MVHDAEKFELLCKVLLLEDENKGLIKSMQLVYCILKCEMDIIQQVNYEIMYPILKERGFDFAHYEEKILQEEKNVQCIIDILKDKELNYFDLFLSCLQKHWPTIFVKIEDEMNYTLIVHNNPPSYTSNFSTSEKLISFRSDLIETYTGQSFQNSFAGLDNKYTFVFPTLIKFDDEESINHKNIFNEEEENSAIIPSCLEMFNKGHRVVLLQGSPGSGKTTIAYKICKEWAKGKLKMFSHVIIMHLEDHRIAGCKTIEEFLELLIGNVEGNKVASEIRKIHGEGVLLILEGWDHLLPEQRRNSLFTDLVKGKLFPKAVIVITGRPSACVSLPYQFIDFKILLFGFTKTQVDEYIYSTSKSHPDGTQVTQKIRSQLIDFQWRVPVNLCIILSILKQIDIKSSPSVTELYKMFVLYLLNRHKEDVYGDNRRIKHFASLSTDLPVEMFNMLQSLARMAFVNILKNNVTFDEEEIRTYCFVSKKFPLHFDGMGLLQVVNSICLYVDRSYQFTHQNLQELLAAWHLSQQTLHFQQQDHKLLDDKEMFIPFYNDFANHYKPSSKSSNCTIC